MNLTAALSATPDLSQLTATLGLFEDLVGVLAATPNLTLLAPSNMAFEELMNSSMASALNDTDMVQAILQYHVLQGTYYAANVTEMPMFIPTSQMNMSYSNVTGGQVVVAVMMMDSVMFMSGLMMNSTVTTAVSFYRTKLLVLPSF